MAVLKWPTFLSNMHPTRHAPLAERAAERLEGRDGKQLAMKKQTPSRTPNKSHPTNFLVLCHRQRLGLG